MLSIKKLLLVYFFIIIMKILLSDFDGVVFDSEFPRALGWYLATRIADGKTSEKILTDRWDLMPIYELNKLAEKDAKMFKAIRKLAGKSTEDTLEGVWALSDKKRSKQYLSAVRDVLKTPLLVRLSKPIQESIDFFIELGKNDIKLGLVTQTDSEMLRRFQQSSNISLDDIFDQIECCGDDFYSEMRKGGKNGIDKKSVGYAIACKLLDTDPRETLCFEDSNSGIQAATNIGLTAIGYKRKGNSQMLSGAALVVSDLERFSNLKCINFIKENPLEKVIDFMQTHSLERNKWIRKKDGKKLLVTSIENTDPRSLAYLRNLDYRLESWDADPAREDAVAEYFTLEGKAGQAFSDIDLATIAEHIEKNEIPLSLKVYGGRTKNPCKITMKVRVGNEEKEIELYSKTEYGLGSSIPNNISGRLKEIWGR